MKSRTTFNHTPNTFIIACALLAFFGGAGRTFGQTSLQWPKIKLTKIAEGVYEPTAITNAGDASGRIFVSEITGLVKIIKDGQLLPVPFLDMSDNVSCCHTPFDEQGFYSIAFPPGDGAKDHFYAMYSDKKMHIRVARFHVSADPDIADRASEETILDIAPIHIVNEGTSENTTVNNGGQLVFGPDGYLYISLGDGVEPLTPSNPAQYLDSLRGKILRIDVESGASPYAIPYDNPFVGVSGARGEIWDRGLKNPWRLSFDRETGDFYIANVGEWAYESIYYEAAGGPGGYNYGWPIMESEHCFDPVEGGPVITDCAVPSDFTPPIADIPHGHPPDGEMEAIMGGYVYRGLTQCGMTGIYFYADFWGDVWGMQNDGTNWIRQDLLVAPPAHAREGGPYDLPGQTAGSEFNSTLVVSSLGEGEDGSIYMAEYKASYSTPSAIYLISEEDDGAHCVRQNDTSGSTGKSGGHCFIATAAYGSYEAPYVKILRKFRDVYMLTNRPGRWLTHTYYRLSPPLADWISRHDKARSVTRAALLPFIGLSWVAVKGGPAAFALALMAPLAMFIFMRRRRVRKSV